MMKQPNVMEAMLRFFQHGFFETEQTRAPIPADWKPESSEAHLDRSAKTSRVGSQR
jgi:hypothetical protein